MIEVRCPRSRPRHLPSRGRGRAAGTGWTRWRYWL